MGTGMSGRLGFYVSNGSVPPFYADPRKACNADNADLFFSPPNERGHALGRRVERAKAVCAICRFETRCRAWALREPEQFGVWGGLTADERRQVVAHGVDEEALGRVAADESYDRDIRDEVAA